MKRKVRLGNILKFLDLPSLGDIAETLLDAEDGRIDEVVDDIAEMIDNLVDWSLVPVGGVVLEALDRPLYCKPIARAIVKAATKRKRLIITHGAG